LTDKTPLARVFDAAELEAIEGGRAALEVRVLAGWAGETCFITVPRTLRCAPCQGGGCDGCGRSGAFRLDASREVVVQLPSPLPINLRLRLPTPFGPGSAVGLLVLDLETAAEPSPSCRVVPKLAPQVERPAQTSPWTYGGLVLLALLALTLLSRSCP
jgi:hypothetical protein